MERNDKKIFLNLHHVFGSNFNLKLKNSLGFLQEDDQMKLIYTAGKSIVKRDL